MLGNEFYAKSAINGNAETIQEHTDAVLKEYEEFKMIYPDCNVDWELLRLACIYHDIGKINKEFQAKIIEGKKSDEEIPHGVLSTLFIDVETLNLIYKDKDEFLEKSKLLFSSIYYHHDRESLTSETVQNNIFKKLCGNKKSEFEIELENTARGFVYDKLNKVVVNRFKENKISRFLGEKEKCQLMQFVMLKGLLNRLDYAASAHISVENKNDFLIDCLDGFMERLADKSAKRGNDKPKWNELQEYMKKNQNKNLVVIAQTGMGKTEAGLWWIGNNKGFFTLPVRTAINAIFKRIKEDILLNKNIDDRIGLLHSESKGIYLQINESSKYSKSNLDWEDYYTKTKQLSLPVTVCTLDQLFTSVFRYRGYESKLATLSYSKIIIDEIQMYGPDIVGFLICGLKMIQELGGKFAVLTATFPCFMKDLMQKQGLIFETPEKAFVDSKKIRHSVQLHKEQLSSEFISKMYNNNRVLVICNTVKKCQQIYYELLKELNLSKSDISDKVIADRELNLFHAKFIHKDRNERETAILEFGRLYHKDGSWNKNKGIWITNTIAEASLDIDFDIIITELSDINGLFQRLGRCYRKREWIGEGHNCHVFDGGENFCSGVGGNVDKEIFNLSKKTLRDFFDKHSSKLSEEDKMDLVKTTYTTENMKNLKYYKKVLACIEVPNLFLTGEKSPQEAQNLFRNICSETIIPSSIYIEEQEVISGLLDCINNPQTSPEERIKSREKLKEYTLELETYNLPLESLNKRLSLGKYEVINVVEAEYDENIGLIKIYKRNGDSIDNII
ncbi:MAG: CRISPR-associated helicase Cas3' [Eubacterium sp.]|nr:CRISPR-associated helicase Cas3' [Gallibacter sp.]MDY6038200.1 CRISPR-associated helicase Cas3' [Eubacterium sp.]